MEFRLLGPLEARSQARALPLGGPKQKSVLALLLLSPNRVVSKDTLIDAVWGEQPPKEVAAALQNAVFRLRQVLGEEPLASVLTSPREVVAAETASTLEPM